MRLSPTDLAIDHHVASLSSRMSFLLEVTPTNADEARDRFLSGSEPEPGFEYRPLSIDPDVGRAAIDLVPLDQLEDATLAKLLRAKLREMRLQIAMLEARGSMTFRQLSLELHGDVDDTLLARAEDVLDRVEVPPPGTDALDSHQFRERAEEEILHYRRIAPDIGLSTEIRADVAGVLCEGTTLIINEGARIAASRVDALIQHEVGTHLVTQANGAAQQITTLGSGLAGYDETQEGLAVLAEIAVGGLTASRLRQLAARVVTAHGMLDGASFADAHARLTDAGIPAGPAFTTVMRVFRGGGYTKDAIYLRGLLDLLAHVRGGGSLDLFYRGKFSLRDLPLVEDLDARGILAPATIMPMHLSRPESAERIRAAAHTDDLLSLVPQTH